jgi:hypothetical protein
MPPLQLPALLAGVEAGAIPTHEQMKRHAAAAYTATPFFAGCVLPLGSSGAALNGR